MKTETLKQLIEVEFERCQNISEFKEQVLRLLDLQEDDSNIVINTIQERLHRMTYQRPRE